MRGAFFSFRYKCLASTRTIWNNYEIEKMRVKYLFEGTSWYEYTRKNSSRSKGKWLMVMVRLWYYYVYEKIIFVNRFFFLAFTQLHISYHPLMVRIFWKWIVISGVGRNFSVETGGREEIVDVARNGLVTMFLLRH